MQTNKVLAKENQINDVDVYLYKVGFIKKHNESRLFRCFRYFVMIAPVIMNVKCICSILIFYFKSNQIDQYKMLLLSLNDFTYYMPKIRFHLNLLYLVSFGNTSLLQFWHYKLLHSNGGLKFYWMKVFEMLSGKIKPSEIGLTHWDDVMVLMKRLDYKIILNLYCYLFLELNSYSH